MDKYSNKVGQVHISVWFRITGNGKYLICAHVHPAICDTRLAVNINPASEAGSRVARIDARRMAPQMEVASFVISRAGYSIQAIRVDEQRVIVNVADTGIAALHIAVANSCRARCIVVYLWSTRY